MAENKNCQRKSSARPSFVAYRSAGTATSVFHWPLGDNTLYTFSLLCVLSTPHQIHTPDWPIVIIQVMYYCRVSLSNIINNTRTDEESQRTRVDRSVVHLSTVYVRVKLNWQSYGGTSAIPIRNWPALCWCFHYYGTSVGLCENKKKLKVYIYRVFKVLLGSVSKRIVLRTCAWTIMSTDRARGLISPPMKVSP